MRIHPIVHPWWVVGASSGDHVGVGWSAFRAAGERHVEQGGEAHRSVRPIIAGVRASGISTYSGLADALNERGIETARASDGIPCRSGECCHLTVDNRASGMIAEFLIDDAVSMSPVAALSIRARATWQRLVILARRLDLHVQGIGERLLFRPAAWIA